MAFVSCTYSESFSLLLFGLRFQRGHICPQYNKLRHDHTFRVFLSKNIWVKNPITLACPFIPFWFQSFSTSVFFIIYLFSFSWSWNFFSINYSSFSTLNHLKIKKLQKLLIYISFLRFDLVTRIKENCIKFLKKCRALKTEPLKIDLLMTNVRVSEYHGSVVEWWLFKWSLIRLWF